MADQYPKVLLPSDLRQNHRSLVLRYLEDSSRISGSEWPKLMEAFDLLNAATVVTEAEQLSFPEVYRQQVEGPYAAAFIERLYTVADVEKETPRLRATVSRVIVRALIEARLYRPEVPGSRFLLAYCPTGGMLSAKVTPLRSTFFATWPELAFSFEHMISVARLDAVHRMI